MGEFPPGWKKTVEDLFRECGATRRPVGPPETEWAIAYERSLLPTGIRNPREGDVYEALVDVSVPFLTHWKAPFTGGGDGVVPKGMRVQITSQTRLEPIAVYARPVDAPQSEAALVPEAELKDPKYGGYSLLLKTATLNDSFRLVAPPGC